MLALGAYGYVMKPLVESDLLMHVANALERRRLEIYDSGIRLPIHGPTNVPRREKSWNERRRLSSGSWQLWG